jgi:hypothetical protein
VPNRSPTKSILALPHHDAAVDGQRLERPTERVDGHPVDPHAVAATHETRDRGRRRPRRVEEAVEEVGVRSVLGHVLIVPYAAWPDSLDF